jgi:hypothetical protein
VLRWYRKVVANYPELGLREFGHPSALDDDSDEEFFEQWRQDCTARYFHAVAVVDSRTD